MHALKHSYSRLIWLVDLALVLRAFGLDILSARAETLGHEVVDTFYVRAASDGTKLTDPIAIERLRAAIVAGVTRSR